MGCYFGRILRASQRYRAQFFDPESGFGGGLISGIYAALFY
jgi:hypothetical protein